MKLIILMMTMIFISCEEIKLDDGIQIDNDSSSRKSKTISGKVTRIFSNLFISSAHAQDSFEVSLNEGIQLIELCPIQIVSLDLNRKTLSDFNLKDNERIEVVPVNPCSTTTTTPTPLTIEELSTIAVTNENFFESIEQSHEDTVENLISLSDFLRKRLELSSDINLAHNLNDIESLKSRMQSNGFIIISGFNAKKELQSYHIIDLEDDGSFKIKDENYDSVSIYEMQSSKPVFGNSSIRSHIITKDKTAENLNLEISPISTTKSLEISRVLKDETKGLVDLENKIAEQDVLIPLRSNEIAISDGEDLVRRTKSILTTMNYFSNQYYTSLVTSLIAIEVAQNPQLAELSSTLTIDVDTQRSSLKSLIESAILKIDPSFQFLDYALIKGGPILEDVESIEKVKSVSFR